MDWNAIITTVVTVSGVTVTIIKVAGPMTVKLTRLFALKSHNQALLNLTARAEVIVNSLQSAAIPGMDKKTTGIEALVKYASETGIKLTADQAAEYIQDAYELVVALSGSSKEDVDDTTEVTTK